MGRQILMIGIGQTGCAIAESMTRKLNIDGICFRSFAFDTDENTLSRLEVADTFSMTDERDLGTVVEHIGIDRLKNSFPCDWDGDHSGFVKSLDMSAGACGWRMKAMLSFASFMNKAEKLETLNGALDGLCEDVEIYLAASLAGGTGSALFLPLILYIKDRIGQAGGKITFTSAFLTMPAIYEGCFTSEQRVKSHANAYAALRELNAVNIATASAGTECFPPIGFRIGEEDGIFGLLFDSDLEKFRNADYKPFDRVYLFERVSGVDSVQKHIDIISETVTTFCKTGFDTTALNTTAVFGGLYLTDIRYPVESIVSYITKKQLHRFMSCEMSGAFYAAAKNRVVSEKSHIRTTGRRVSDEFPIYCHAYKTEAESYIREHERAEALLDRDYGVASGDGVFGEIFSYRTVADLDEAVTGSFSCEASQQIYLATVSGTYDDLNEDSKKARKRRSKKEFSETAELTRSLLDAYYAHMLSELEKKDEFVQRFIAGGEGSGFSVVESILKEGGAYVHPMYALVRLCGLYDNIERRLQDQAPISERDLAPRLRLADLAVSQVKRARTKYAKEGSTRFSYCLTNESDREKKTDDENLSEWAARAAEAKRVKDAKLRRSTLLAMADDAPLFFDDLKEVYEKLTRKCAYIRWKLALEQVQGLIERYRALLDAMSRFEGDVAASVKLCALVGGADSGNVVNVGASAEEKEALYKAYTEKTYGTPADLDQDDRRVGELVAAFALSEGEGRVRREALFGLLDKIEGVFRNRILASDFYKTEIDRNIIDVVTEAVESKNTSAGKIFAGRKASLAVGIPADPTVRSAIESRASALLPMSARERILTLGLCGENDPIEYIEGLMFRCGEYKGNAIFADHIPHHEMYVRKDEFNLPLYTVDAVNEKEEDCIGYKSYQKALFHANVQMTPMWDPALSYHRGRRLPLPYIDPEKQREYEIDTGKALLYAFMSGSIRTSCLEEVGEVYFMDMGLEIKPMCFEGKPISAGDIRSCLLWAYCDPEWVSTQSTRYELDLKRTRESYPAFHSEMLTSELGRKKASDTRFFNALWSVMADLLCAYQAREMLACGSAACIAEAAYLTLRRFCLGGAEEISEISAMVYNALLASFESVLCERCGEEGARQLIQWLNDGGRFLQYTFSTGFCKLTRR